LKQFFNSLNRGLWSSQYICLSYLSSSEQWAPVPWTGSAKVFSPLPTVVTKRNSTDHLTTQPGALLLQPPTYSSSNPAVHPVTPDLAFTISPLVGNGQVSRRGFSPLLPFVSKRNSTGHLFTQTGLPLQPPADSSSDLAVYPVTPDLDLTILPSAPDMDVTKLDSETTKMKNCPAKQAMQQELDAMELRMADFLPSPSALSFDEAVATVDDDYDNESFLAVVCHDESYRADKL
jgi:hypothetical protein